MLMALNFIETKLGDDYSMEKITCWRYAKWIASVVAAATAAASAWINDRLNKKKKII